MFYRTAVLKIFKKAVKLGSFLQCSVHIFLGHDGCVWKNDLRILWIHIMKNFQVKHDQCGSVVLPPKYLLLKAISYCWTFALLTAGYFTFDVLKSIHKFIIELHALQCLFVNKNKGRLDYFKFHKRRDFFISYDKSTLGGNLVMLSPFLDRSKKAFLFGQEDNIPGHLIERRAY